MLYLLRRLRLRHRDRRRNRCLLPEQTGSYVRLKIVVAVAVARARETMQCVCLSVYPSRGSAGALFGIASLP